MTDPHRGELGPVRVSRYSAWLLGIGILAAVLDSFFRFVTPVPINFFGPVAYTLLILQTLENRFEVQKMKAKMTELLEKYG